MDNHTKQSGLENDVKKELTNFLSNRPQNPVLQRGDIAYRK